MVAYSHKCTRSYIIMSSSMRHDDIIIWYEWVMWFVCKCMCAYACRVCICACICIHAWMCVCVCGGGGGFGVKEGSISRLPAAVAALSSWMPELKDFVSFVRGNGLLHTDSTTMETDREISSLTLHPLPPFSSSIIYLPQIVCLFFTLQENMTSSNTYFVNVSLSVCPLFRINKRVVNGISESSQIPSKIS